MIRKIVVAIFLALLLIVGTHLAISAWAKPRLERLEAIWREEVFHGEMPTVAYPVRQTDAAARRVEQLAAEMGIQFRSADGSPVTDGAELELEPSLVTAGNDYLRLVVRSEGFEVGPLPTEAEAILDRLEPTVEAVVETVLKQTPRWGLDVERGLEMAEVDYSAHRALHKLLVLSSWSALARGDEPVARRRADAAANLRRAIEPDPVLIAALIVPSEVAIEVPLQLRLCPAREVEVTLDPDLRELYRRSLHGEAWGVFQSISQSEEIAEAGWPISLLAGELSRAALIHFAEAVESGASALEDTPWQRFDAAAHFKEHSEAIPSWNSIARVPHVNGYGGWDVAVRTELSRELLGLVRSERGRPGPDDPSGVTAEETIRSEVDPALSWHAARSGGVTLFSLRDAEGERVLLDDVGEQARGLLTAYRVDVGRCAIDS